MFQIVCWVTYQEISWLHPALRNLQFDEARTIMESLNAGGFLGYELPFPNRLPAGAIPAGAVPPAMGSKPATWLWLPFILLASPPVEAQKPFYDPDPSTPATYVRISSLFNIFNGLGYNLDVYMPQMRGNLPVLYFLTGNQGEAEYLTIIE